jgi:Domain of unknown function(DUF2779)
MRHLTKSRFKTGLECPNKLFYCQKSEYANIKKEDTFLMALAQGGFQVEEYARMHFPNGVLIDSESDGYDYDKLCDETAELLKQENVIIYEAAFKFGNLFIRVDILKKTGLNTELIEVKAKSSDSDNENFIGDNGGLNSKWKPYLFDVAFQKYVIQNCYPTWSINSFLMLADKTKQASVDGLNQMFRISKKGANRTGIQNFAGDISNTGSSVLVKTDISGIVEDIIIGKYKCLDNKAFIEAVELLAENYKNDIFASWPASNACKKCEFKCSANTSGLLSGFENCFSQLHGWTNIEFAKPQIFDIWDLRDTSFYTENLYFKEQLNEEFLKVKYESNKISRSERQWIQVTKELTNDYTFYLLKDELKSEIDKLVYPLHFIDFETSTVALPFYAGRKPYEQIAFQFSHHLMDQDGKIEHKNEFMFLEKGMFPNFEFVRELKKALETDFGSIFKYSSHENTVLNQIRTQLLESTEIDKTELIEFIEKISHNTGKSTDKWKGERDMVDLWEWVKKYYYNPLTKGSNSIKAYLPAVLNSSPFLKNKYAKPLSEIGVDSLNFNASHVWISFDAFGNVINPYKNLPPVFEAWSEEEIEESLSDIENIADGGAALTAFGKLQFTEMSEDESEMLRKSLLKYCELDTLAMIMIFEHFLEIR